MSDKKTPEISRRNFLSGVGTAAVGAAALVTPGVSLEAAQKKAPRWAMVMDLRRCIGCRACTVACKAENDVSLGRFRAVIQEETTGTFPDTKKAFLPLMCNHCEGNEKDGVPPCVKICPQFPGKRAKFKGYDGKTIRFRSGGTYKRPDGMILIDKEQCIGCGKCIDACPYGVRSFDPFVKSGGDTTKQAVDKCDMCTHRVDNGVEPHVSTPARAVRVSLAILTIQTVMSPSWSKSTTWLRTTTSCLQRKAPNRMCSISTRTTC